MDLFILSEDKKLVTVYSLDPSGERYRATEATASAENGYEIIDGMVSDFNHDGFLDLLLSQRMKSVTKDESSVNDFPIKHQMFLGNSETLKLSGWNIPSSKDYLMMLDAKGRMLVDLLGVPVDEKSDDLMIWSASLKNENGEGAVEGNQWAITTGYTLERFESLNSCRPVKKQSHAFADFNGDGFADLLLTCSGSEGNYLKLLTSESEKNRSVFRNPLIINLPKGHGPISLGDLNGDGAMDVIYAVCDPPGDCSLENSIHVLFNSQRPFCERPNQKNCKTLSEIMDTDSKFVGFLESDRLVVRIDKEKYLLNTESVLSVGDYDLNGFPDVLVIVKDVESGQTHPILLENLPNNGNKNIRTFERLTKGTEELENISEATGAHFINFYQDGPPDILVNSKTQIHTIQNGFFQDAFFLRTEALNGVCPAPCVNKRTGSLAQRPYGSSFPGPTVKFSFTDFDGSLKIRSGSQLSQSGQGRLNTPFLLFGLGRTNNFVELLAVRTPFRSGPNLAKKAGLVPNSDLIINSPHPDSPSAFHFELHILPGQYFLWVLISIGTAMLVLGSLTAYFKWREIKEDNEERKKALHSINFDAL